jgi:single-strand DNA-binding protein
MSNPRNTGTRIGRLARDPKVFTNKDGSKTVLFTLMVDRNYTNAQDVREADAIDLEAFVSNKTNGNGPYDRIHAGDLVAVQDTIRKNVYQKNGQTVYEQKLMAEEITFLESKTTTQARLAKRAAEAEAENRALQAQAQADAPVAEQPVAPAQSAEPAYAGATNYDEPPF